MYEEFVANRINGDESIWSKMTLRRLKTFKTNDKIVTVKVKDQVIQLKEERDLMSRFVIASRARIEINLPEIFNIKYEFTVLPRSMFARDGNLLIGTDKCQVMAKIESLMVDYENIDEMEDKNGEEIVSSTVDEIITNIELSETKNEQKVIIFDGMALVNKLKKNPYTKTCSDLSELFIQKIESEIKGFEIVVLIFDRYQEESLKGETRRKRNKDEATRYVINDQTNIQNISLKKLLGHWKTKQDLTEYLGNKVAHYLQNRTYAVINGTKCQTNIKILNVLLSEHNQEEADTLMILCAQYLAIENSEKTLYISSPDTDVLLLLIANYKHLCRKTFFRTGKGDRVRNIDVRIAHQKIGLLHSSALLGFHAITGCDQTAKFNGRSKGFCWKKFREASDKMLTALLQLGETLDLALKH